MSITKSELMKLQNGSDVRGIACEGIEGEHVTLIQKQHISSDVPLHLAVKEKKYCPGRMYCRCRH